MNRSPFRVARSGAALALVGLVMIARAETSPLVDPAELAKNPAMGVVLDVRAEAAFKAGHVPGAIRVDVAEWEQAFKSDRDPAAWGKRIGGLGINGKRPVLVFGDDAWPTTARVWFILTHFGVPDVRMVDGGWKAWSGAGHPIDTNETLHQVGGSFPVKISAGCLLEKAELKGKLPGSADPLQILDARTPEEYSGEKKMGKRAGRIPGSVNIPWTKFVDPKTGRFLPKEEIRKMLTGAGFDLAKPITTHCQSGGRSSVTYFALTLAGATRASNYYGSFGEWGADESLPVTTGNHEPTTKSPEVSAKRIPLSAELVLSGGAVTFLPAFNSELAEVNLEETTAREIQRILRGGAAVEKPARWRYLGDLRVVRSGSCGLDVLLYVTGDMDRPDRFRIGDRYYSILSDQASSLGKLLKVKTLLRSDE
jgi:thiosulfate/3-mercaptopyruvate sulfurtransferase